MDQNQNTDNAAGAVAPAAPCAVWLVVGETGEYSDYSCWNVAAFTTEKLANHFRDLCQGEADKALERERDGTFRQGFKHAYDTHFTYDYPGASYYVEMVEVFSSSPPNVQADPPVGVPRLVLLWLRFRVWLRWRLWRGKVCPGTGKRCKAINCNISLDNCYVTYAKWKEENDREQIPT